jgi:hypothetical protein
MILKSFRLLSTLTVIVMGFTSCSPPRSETKAELTEAIQLELISRELNSGLTNEARNSLNLDLDGLILGINLTLGQEDEQTRRAATNIFRRIAMDRATAPPNSIDSLQEPKVQQQVSRILNDASQRGVSSLK